MNDGNVMGAKLARYLWHNNDDKLLFFERAGLFFFFNFNPEKSFADYPVEIIPGTYMHMLDSDEERFGGQGRILQGQELATYSTVKDKVKNDYINIYLPARTAMVLQRSVRGE